MTIANHRAGAAGSPTRSITAGALLLAGIFTASTVALLALVTL